MATKIIKPGKTSGTFRFRCHHCGCIFETDITSTRFVWDRPDHFADCPMCHRLCLACDGDKK